MEPSSPTWLTDLVEDDISISFPHDQYQMMLRSLDDSTLNDLHSFENHSSFDSFPRNPSSLFDGTANPQQPRNLDKSPSISPTSKMISFSGGEDHDVCAAEVKQREELVSSKKMNCCNSDHYKGKQAVATINGGGSTRNVFSGQEHVVAERKRREKISQRLIALSAVLPGLKKMDKASVLGEATKYVNHLQERIKKLEMEVSKKSSMESVVFVKKRHVVVSPEENSSSSDETLAGFQTSDKNLLEIEARVSQKHVLIRVHCERRIGCSAKVLDRIGKMNLTVLNNSVISFGNSLLDITVVAQMEDEFSMTIEELVRNLRQYLMSPT